MNYAFYELWKGVGVPNFIPKEKGGLELQSFFFAFLFRFVTRWLIEVKGQSDEVSSDDSLYKEGKA